MCPEQQHSSPHPGAFLFGEEMATEAQQLVAQQAQQFQGLLDRQKSEQTGLFDSYKQQINSQPKLTDVFAKAQQDRGLGALQENIGLFQGQIGNVKSLIDRLGENTAQRTSGTQANQAYLDRMRAVEGGQLNTQLGRLGAGLEPVVQAYGLASQDVGQLLELTKAQQAKELQPIEMQVSSLGDRFAREITGYTQNSQNELNVLLDKIQRDREISDREWQRAQQLAGEEREFQRQRAYLSAQNNQSVLGIGASKGTAAAKPNGGFAFADENGNSISAAKFAQINNVGIGDLLYRMGQKGDKFAAQTYNAIKAAPGVAARPQQIFWGT